MFSSPAIYILLVVLLLLVGVIFLYVVIRKARRSATTTETALVAAEASEAEQLNLTASSVGLKLSFSRAMRRIRAYGKNARYRVPWYLMVGETHSGKTTLLSNTGLGLLASAPDEKLSGVKQGLNWFFFDRGIVLDVAGDLILRPDGATSNVGGWNYLTKLLRSYRPQRPLDGIILTIPSEDLRGAESRRPEYKLKLEQKAQALYNKLVDLQKRLGLNLPVYVLITKCDRVTGFKSLCHEVPAHLDEMLGWSSPYTREIAYRAEWVSEAFQTLHSNLFQLQVEIFAGRDAVMNSDEFFMLPSEIRLMRAPLQIYLDQIFKESAYHEPLFLRGIYLCGDGAGELPASAVVLKTTEQQIDWTIPPPGAPRTVVAEVDVTPASTTEKRYAFAGHLFERKIFQEELLARPIHRTTLSRNRWVVAAQVLSLAIPLIGLLGILLTYPAHKERKETFYTYLTKEEQELKAVKAEKEGGLIDDRSQNRVAQLFDAMSNVGGKSLYSLFIPGSWFSRVTEESGNSISGSYQFLVYDTLRQRLDCRTENKLIPQASSQACYATLNTDSDKLLSRCAPESDSSSNSVHSFIEGLDELLQNRARYNRLIHDDTGDLSDLNLLLRYFDQTPLPANFDVHNGLFVQALRTSQRPALKVTDQSVYDRAACKVEGMIQDIYDRTFKDQNVTYGYLGDITKAEALLSQPENAWLANRIFEYPSAFEGLTFADGLSELKRALNDLSKEKFMSRDNGTQPGASSAGAAPQYDHQSRSALVWDKATLQQAVDLYKDYYNFVTNNSYNRRDTLDASVKRAALSDFRRKFVAIIQRAPSRQIPQRMPNESARKASLRVEVKSLVDAQDLLSNLLEICRGLGIDVGLRSAIANQLSALMSAVDEEFYAGSFYAMAQDGFLWWTLDAPFHSYTLFGASNPDELEVYLAVQREGIAELARQYAAPVIGFASALNIQLRSSVNWREITDQLDKYDAKKPGSTVAVLENFIRTEMNKVKIEDCGAIVAGSTLQPLDYFIRVRNSIRQPFYSRCQALEAESIARADELARESARLAREKQAEEFYRGLKSYTDIQEKFNRTLAGRFPFSDLPASEPFAEADPDSISAFFDLLAKNKDAARKILQEAPNYNINPQEALAFLDQMDTVGLFFNAFLSKKQVYPIFDFNLHFRANREKEVGANQIIDWDLDVGTKQFHLQDPSPAGVWGYGDPLKLSLRWASDAPALPSFKFDALSHMKLQGQTVTVTYSNNWALLYFILKHRGAGTDFKDGVDIEPYTLKIEIPTEPNARLSNMLQQAQPAVLRTDTSEVFMSIGLVAPGKKEPLLMPDSFPAYAPQLIKGNSATRQRRETRSN